MTDHKYRVKEHLVNGEIRFVPQKKHVSEEVRIFGVVIFKRYEVWKNIFVSYSINAVGGFVTEQEAWDIVQKDIDASKRKVNFVEKYHYK